MIISTFANERDNLPKRVEGPWEDLVEDLAEYVATPCTLATCARSDCPYKRTMVGAWSPASWPDGATRARDTVEAVAALVVDLDHVPPADLERHLERLAGYAYVMTSTHSDSPADRCVRVVVRLSRPVPGAEWASCASFNGAGAVERRMRPRTARPPARDSISFNGAGAVERRMHAIKEGEAHLVWMLQCGRRRRAPDASPMLAATNGTMVLRWGPVAFCHDSNNLHRPVVAPSSRTSLPLLRVQLRPRLPVAAVSAPGHRDVQLGPECLTCGIIFGRPTRPAGSQLYLPDAPRAAHRPMWSIRVLGVPVHSPSQTVSRWQHDAARSHLRPSPRVASRSGLDNRTEDDKSRTVTTRSENRRTRDSFTRTLERICERLDKRNYFDVTHASMLGEKLQSHVEIINLWVVGSYARGATRCGDLDLVVEMRATGGGMPMPRTVAAQAFGRLKDVSIYQGIPDENTSGLAFPEAVHAWSKGGNWREALTSIAEDPDAGHFARESDVLPLRPQQLSTSWENLEKLIAMRADHILDWTFVPYEATVLGPRSDEEESVERLTQFWGARSRELVPHVLKYLRTRPFTSIARSSNRAELRCSGARILVGRPAVPYDELNQLTCSRVVLAPHVSRRGHNGLLEIRRGERHPLEEAAAPLRFFVLRENSGAFLSCFLGARFGSALMVELFHTEQDAREMAETFDDTETVVDVIGGTALLDFVSCADVLEIYEHSGSLSTLAMTRYGASALGEQEGDVTGGTNVEVAQTKEVLRHLRCAGLGRAPSLP